MKHWAVRVMIALNQCINATTGGDPQMSLSARAGFARDHGSHIAHVWCKVFDTFDRHHPNPTSLWTPGMDHCDLAIVEYRHRKGEVK